MRERERLAPSGPATDDALRAVRRPAGLTLLSLLFGLVAGSAWREAWDHLFSTSGEPGALLPLQIAAGTAGLVAAIGLWRCARWAPLAVLIYGVVTATLVLLLGPLLDLAGDERAGLWAGAAAIIALVLACAWYARRLLRQRAIATADIATRPL